MSAPINPNSISSVSSSTTTTGVPTMADFECAAMGALNGDDYDASTVNPNDSPLEDMKSVVIGNLTNDTNTKAGRRKISNINNRL